VTTSEIDKLYASLLRIEERLRCLETREAVRRGSDGQKDLTRGVVLGWIAGIAGVTGVVTAIVGRII